MASSPRVSFDSRPHSRAQSDASLTSFATAFTERPGSSHSVYSVSREIDHIKSLITRSQVATSPVQGTITAQVFRRERPSSISSISPNLIVQELDSLKRRIKNDRPQPERRPSQIDPGAESDRVDDDDDAFPDEREDEIVRLKEEIVLVRAQEEQLLAAAEDRVDLLTGQKEDLERHLQTSATELAALREEKAQLAESLRHAEKQLVDVQSEQPELLSATAAARQQIAELQEANSHVVKELQARIEQQIADHNATNDKLVQLQQKHDQVTASLESSTAHAGSLDAILLEQRELVQQKSVELTALHVTHEKEVDELRSTHASERKIWETALTDELQTAETAHKAKLSQIKKSHAKALEDAQTASQTELESLKSQHAAALESITEQHNQALNAAKQTADQDRIAHEKLLDETRQAHATATAELRQSIVEDSENSAKLAHEQEIQELKSTHATDLERLRNVNQEQLGSLRSELSEQAEQRQKDHERERAEADSKWETKIADLEKQHSQTCSEIRESESEASAAKVQELTRQHAENISRAVEDTRRDLTEQSTAAHKEELYQLREALHSEIAAAQAELVSKTEAHIKDIERLQTQSATESAALSARLEAEQNLKISAQENVFKAEVAAIQARLDAALSGQAEAERALAAHRQLKSDEHKRLSQANASLEESITRLKEENQALSAQFDQTERSYRKLKRASIVTASPDLDDGENLAALRLQLASEEHDRQEAEAALKDAQTARAEIARQNEFLVQRLQVLQQALTQRSPAKRPMTPDERAPVPANADDTDPKVPEPKTDLRAVRPIRVETYQPKSTRPMSPLSPNKREAREEIDRAWKDRSFEDYLDNAQAELAELGTVITANEALFARKIKEHVGDLQRAKDALAAEYKTKFEKLSDERVRMEQTISIKQAVDFAEERRALIASYGAEVDRVSGEADAKNLSHHRAQALRNAEQRLVKEYNRRVARRTSELALRHAAEFQNLTLDYDRRMAELLNNRRALEGDLSVDPAKFEQDMEELDAQLDSEMYEAGNGSPNRLQSSNGQLVAGEHASRSSTPSSRLEDFDFGPDLKSQSQQPLQTPVKTSVPRTHSSLPRAVPSYLSNRNSPYATSQPLHLRRAQTTDARRAVTNPAPTTTPSTRPSGPPELSRSITAINHNTTSRPIPNLPMSPLSAHPPFGPDGDDNPGPPLASSSPHAPIPPRIDSLPTGPRPGPAPAQNAASTAYPYASSVSSPTGSQSRLPTAADVFEQHAAQERASLEAARPGFLKRTKDRLQSRRSNGRLSSAMIYDVPPKPVGAAAAAMLAGPGPGPAVGVGTAVP